jgi:cell division protein FtsL
VVSVQRELLDAQREIMKLRQQVQVLEQQRTAAIRIISDLLHKQK